MFIRIESHEPGVAFEFNGAEIAFPGDLVRVTIAGAVVFEQPRSRLKSWTVQPAADAVRLPDDVPIH